jgi:hypothetical protein
MSSETGRKPSLYLDLELRPLEGQDVESDLFLLPPSLEDLLGRPNFGQSDPIEIPVSLQPVDGWALFGPLRKRGFTLH